MTLIIEVISQKIMKIINELADQLQVIIYGGVAKAGWSKYSLAKRSSG